MTIELSGSKKFLTSDPTEYLQVQEGIVYVYIVYIENEVTGRSIFLCERSEGDVIPTLCSANSSRSERYQFLIMAADIATLESKEVGDDNDERRATFLESVGVTLDENLGFSRTLIDWYQNKLIKEERKIKEKELEQNRIRESKVNLMGSVFKTRKSINFDDHTESHVYNVMSVYCEYLNLEICSYQTLISAVGEDFTVYDIARVSHFVVRKVKLEKGWYKVIDEPLIAFKYGHKPVICIPQRRGKYMMYDFEDKTSCIIEESEAEDLEELAVIAYEHLPYGKLKLNDVTWYGIKHVNRTDIRSFCIMYLFTTLVGLLLPVLNEMFYDNLIPLSKVNPIFQVGSVMLSVMIGNIFFSLVQSLANFRGVKKMEYSIMAAAYDRVFRLPQRFIESFGTMELIGRINSIPAVFSTTVSSGVSAVMGMVLSCFYLWKMFDKSFPLAIRGLVVTVISGVAMYFFGRLRIQPERKRLEESTRANATLFQLISGVLKIKTSGIENRGLYEFQKTNSKALKYDTYSSKVNQLGGSINILLSMLYTGLIYYIVVKKRQDLSLGEYSAFNIAYGMFTSAAHQLINFFLTNASLIPTMDRIRPLFEQEVENTSDNTLSGALEGNIEINHLSFTYADENVPVLKDISLKIHTGEYIGIVGPSGCGKSTLLKCLLGFEKATKGKIYYDDKDIDTLDKCDLRRRMGVVLQEGQLVMGNILSNITLSAPDLEVEQVEQILEDVGLKKDVDQMPMGIYTNVSEGGGTVSGGQKQRILIARALANNPKIIMFDEATSALDNITQQTVCDTLAKHNMTRIMIAHRLSTVKNCDRIIVMDKGQIVETGNFEELMEKQGMFYELAKRQTL